MKHLIENSKSDEVRNNVRNLFDSNDIQGRSGVDQWRDDEVAKLGASLLFDTGNSFRALIQKLRSFRVPEQKIPLLDERDRLPFFDLRDETIIEAVKNVLAYPEKDGLLSSIIREVLKVPYLEPDSFLRVEIHFDSKNRIVGELQQHLVLLGFESDNFHQFIPANYHDHYTLRFNVPRINRGRYNELKKIARKNGSCVEAIVESLPSADGYVEYEYYRSDSQISRYQFRLIAPQSIDSFPFPANYLDVSAVPTTTREALDSGISLHIKKRADIHIEIPSTAKTARFPEADSNAMNTLRSKLISCGFYEVTDVWGDTIYTAQFSDFADASQVYRTLDAYFSRYGGPTQMYIEPCARVWRKACSVNGEETLANIPPIVAIHEANKVGSIGFRKLLSRVFVVLLIFPFNEPVKELRRIGRAFNRCVTLSDR